MKFLFDLFPVALFVAAYAATGNLYVATAVIIPATLAQVIFAKVKFGHVDKMLWASLILVLVMGGLTLILQDKRFIMWKPTVLYWTFALVFALAPLVAGRNLVRAMLEREVHLPEALWLKLYYAWAGFFALMGAANLYVAYNYSERFWVQFKLWGGIGFMIAFALAQGVVLMKYAEGER